MGPAGYRARHPFAKRPPPQCAASGRIVIWLGFDVGRGGDRLKTVALQRGTSSSSDSCLVDYVYFRRGTRTVLIADSQPDLRAETPSAEMLKLWPQRERFVPELGSTDETSRADAFQISRRVIGARAEHCRACLKKCAGALADAKTKPLPPSIGPQILLINDADCPRA